jgi:RNA recognition motif-containing protein
MHHQQHYSERGHTPPSAKLPNEQISYKIFVGGLDLNTKEEDLANYFSMFGKVIEKLIKMDVKTKRSRGFGFVGFKHPESVDKVLQYQDHFIHGRKIDCKRAMTKEAAFSLNQSLKGQCRKVFISNIPRDFSKQDVLNCFQMFGELDDVNLMFKKKETGFCYITFSREEDAKPLIDRGVVKYRGAELAVKLAIPKDQKEPDKVIPTLDHLDQPRSRGSNMQMHNQSMSTQGTYGSYQQSQQMPMHPAQTRFRHSFEDGESYSHLNPHLQIDQHPGQIMRAGSGEYHHMTPNYGASHHSSMSPASHTQFQPQYYDFNAPVAQHPSHRGSSHSSALLVGQSHQQQSNPQSPLRREPVSPFVAKSPTPTPQLQPTAVAAQVPSTNPIASFEQEPFPHSYHYKGNSFGGQQGGFDLPIGLREPHRLRVMSDQQINTHYKNFGMSASPNNPSMFAPPDRRSSGVNMVPGSPGYGAEDLGSIGAERERRYNFDAHEASNVVQKATSPSNQFKMHPATARTPQPAGEFYENDFNFKDQFLKLKPQSQNENQPSNKQPNSGNLAGSGNPGLTANPVGVQQSRNSGIERAGSPTQTSHVVTSAKKQKRERVRALEEDIKQLKDRLRQLEDQLKEAYSTVEEDSEEKDAQEGQGYEREEEQIHYRERQRTPSPDSGEQ